MLRALKLGAPDFLMKRVAEDFSDRLGVIRRPFARSLDLCSPTDHVSRAVVDAGRARPLRATTVSGGDVVIDDEAQPFAPGCFDLVVSGLHLQWANDLPGVFAQVRRALAPDGLFLACMAGGASLAELRAAFSQAEEEIQGGASPRVAPFVEVRDLGSLLQRAGFSIPVTDVDSFTLRYESMFALMHELRSMGATNALVSRSAKPLRRDVAARAAQIYHSRFGDADGRVRATFEIVWLSGWAPHESQQKPLAPGSAQMRLADALKAHHPAHHPAQAQDPAKDPAQD